MATCRNSRSALTVLSRHLSRQQSKVCPLPTLGYRFKSDRPNSDRRAAPVRVPSGGTGEKVLRVSPNAAQQLNLDSTPFESVETMVNGDKETFNLLTPAEYYDDLKTFVEFTRRQDSILAVYPPTKDLPAAPVLHDLGCIVMQASRGMNTPLAMSLWLTASNWGFKPSLLSLVWILVRSGVYNAGPDFKAVERRFQALVKTKTDPIAMAIEGEILYRKGDYPRAEEILRAAVIENHSGKGSFEGWEPNCQLTLGKTLAMRGKRDEAAAILQKLSDDGYIEADLQLGKVLRHVNDDEALKYLYKAGCTGALEAFEEMAVVELERAPAAKSSSEAAEHRRWAAEYSRLADGRAPL